MTLKYIQKILAQRGPLPSSEIEKELVLHYKLSRDAARKRIQRAHSSGNINRFIRLKAGGYLYYLPDKHSKDNVINTCKMYLDSYRPRLGRIVKVVDNFKLVSVFEICRLSNLRVWVSQKDFMEYFLRGKRIFNPKLVKILEELQLLGITWKQDWKQDYVVSSSLNTNSINNLIGKAKKDFEDEAHLLYLAQNYFLETYRAREITLYRTPDQQSLSNKFDAIGYGGFRKKATIILELYSRRPILVEDLIGYSERTWSTISGKKFPKPVFCCILGGSFSEDALRYAHEKEMQVFGIDKNLHFHRIESFMVPEKKVKKEKRMRGRFADAQGEAFESAVERVFKKRSFKTETRKNFYLKGNHVAEKGKHRLTDIDVFVTKDNNEVILIECKSAKKQTSRSKLLRIVRNHNKISTYLVKKIGKGLVVSSIYIGYCNELDIIDAKRKSTIPIAFLTPLEFYQQYKRNLKGTPEWLFIR